jgi:hypothetical protein
MKRCALLLAAVLAGCGGDGDLEPIEPQVFLFTFDNDLEEWQPGFADYPIGAGPGGQQVIDEFFELASEHAFLPQPLDTADGAIRLSGNNHSDSLFMFLKRRISGLDPDATYQLELRVEIATNAPSGCFGVGGSPGESVFIKGGAVAIEPIRVADDMGDNWVMNIDKGDQGDGGVDAQVLGDFANSKDCDSGDFSYELKMLSNLEQAEFFVTTDPEGEAWVIVGTDSGHEGTTTIFYTEIEAMFIKAAN